MNFLLADVDSNWLKIGLPILTAIIAWVGEHFRLKNKIKDRDHQLDALKRKREIEDVKTAESLQHGQTLLDVTSRAKDAGISIDQLDDMKQFLLDGKVVKPATREQIVQTADEKKHIVEMQDGSQRMVWTDPVTKQDVFEIHPRTAEQIKDMRDNIQTWLKMCEDRRMEKRHGPTIIKTVSGTLVNAVHLYPAEVMDRIKDYPDIASALEHNQAISKLIALDWVLGRSFGWPVHDFDKPSYKPVEPETQSKKGIVVSKGEIELLGYLHEHAKGFTEMFGFIPKDVCKAMAITQETLDEYVSFLAGYSLVNASALDMSTTNRSNFHVMQKVWLMPEGRNLMRKIEVELQHLLQKAPDHDQSKPAKITLKTAAWLMDTAQDAVLAIVTKQIAG